MYIVSAGGRKGMCGVLCGTLVKSATGRIAEIPPPIGDKALAGATGIGELYIGTKAAIIPTKAGYGAWVYG